MPNDKFHENMKFYISGITPPRRISLHFTLPSSICPQNSQPSLPDQTNIVLVSVTECLTFSSLAASHLFGDTFTTVVVPFKSIYPSRRRPYNMMLNPWCSNDWGSCAFRPKMQTNVCAYGRLTGKIVAIVLSYYYYCSYELCFEHHQLWATLDTS